ncbi:hypothetical protein EVAR_38583_1 [Eumeta japonica]|uniref:Uncharacterized protein n=1 Tax=Eumeta variegata TaxID=151549 RepID=A0A4C1WSI9_EUMVA|nr:hypothetical protein EVAR_38583_1 [Eumeta japonica]
MDGPRLGGTAFVITVSPTLGMPSARDCPMGFLLRRHLGIGSHVKLEVRTDTSEGSSGRRGECTGMMTFKGRNDWGGPYS